MHGYDNYLRPLLEYILVLHIYVVLAMLDEGITTQNVSYNASRKNKDVLQKKVKGFIHC